ncbi:hypothetical protein LTR66_015675, partial [Elasticomyces elasticus]
MSTIASAPSSPPDLSRSYTNSSASRTSRMSTPENSTESSMNFEEIALRDDKEIHKMTTTDFASSLGLQGSKVMRKASNKRPALATLQTKHSSGYLRALDNGVVRSATVAGTKRIPTVNTTPKERTIIRSNSMLPLASVGSFARTPASTLAIPQSQRLPRRRTARQLEAEYHESDDDLPEDASLFNVPVSPFLSSPRANNFCGANSPEGVTPSSSPAPHPLAHARTLPDSPQYRGMHSQIPPKRKPLPRSNTTVLKSTLDSPRAIVKLDRTKSWHTHLDHEARSIAEKLDYHAELLSRKPSLVTNNRASAPGAIPLPPIQRSELDFMPTSKEKEAILSRTRPSWLPPKDPREEKKHLQEYQRMMRASLVADKKREDIIKSTSCTNDDTRAALRRVWQYYIEPSTDVSTIDTRVHGLCYRGVPSQFRGQVWSRAIGNSLELASHDYTTCCLKVASIKSASPDHLTEQDRKSKSSFEQIVHDAETAFPELNIFQRCGPQHNDLISICEAYVVYSPDLGYSYGLHLIAALLLLQLPDPVDAFILLANVLNCSLPFNFHTKNTKQTNRYFAKLNILLEQKSPQLHTYLFNHSTHNEQPGLALSAAELFTPMCSTLLTNGLDLERLCRIWDIWVFEGDKYIIRAVATLLSSLEQQIYEVE